MCRFGHYRRQAPACTLLGQCQTTFDACRRHRPWWRWNVFWTSKVQIFNFSVGFSAHRIFSRLDPSFRGVRIQEHIQRLKSLKITGEHPANPPRSPSRPLCVTITPCSTPYYSTSSARTQEGHVGRRTTSRATSRRNDANTPRDPTIDESPRAPVRFAKIPRPC